MVVVHLITFQDKKGESKNEKYHKTIILAVAVAALAALLLAGCHEGNRPSTELRDRPSAQLKNQEELVFP